MALDVCRGVHRGDDAVSDLACVGAVLQQDRELVAAQPGDGVVWPQTALEALGDDPQELVAGSVPSSLTILKLSRSQNRTSTFAEASTSARSRRCANNVLFGRPVSASWVAWYSSRPPASASAVRRRWLSIMAKNCRVNTMTTRATASSRSARTEVCEASRSTNSATPAAARGR